LGCTNRVSLHVSGLPCRAAANQFAELEHDRIGNAVEDTVAGTLPADQSRIEEDLKVFRYVRLICFQPLDDLVDGHRSTLKGLQDTEAERLAEDLEPSGN